MALGWDTLAKPFRGVGRILRGKFKQGLHDIGGAFSEAAPIVAWVPGVGPIAAGAMGAGGELLKEATDNRPGIQWGDVAQSGLRGGLSGLASGALGGIKGVVGGTRGAVSSVGRFLTGAPGAAAPTAVDAITSAGVQPVTDAMTSSIPSSIGKFLSGAGQWAGKHIGDIAQGVGAATTLYGAAQDASQNAWVRAQMERDRANREALARTLNPVYADLIRSLQPQA